MAVTADRDFALRRLMRRALEAVGYAIVECDSASQLALALRTSAALSAPRAFLAVAASVAATCGAGIVAACLYRTWF